MSRYDEMSLTQFFGEMSRRLDGIATILVALIIVATAITAPLLDYSIGRLSDWTLAWTAAGSLPVLFVYYASLVYFSASGRASVALNAVLIAAFPLLLVYLA